METKKSDKVPMRDVVRLTLRGYRIWWKNHPGMLISSAASNIVEALAPFVSIYLSALIINEIAGARNPQVLTRLVLITLLSAACMALLGAILKRWRNHHCLGEWFKLNMIFNQKLFSLDFRSIDDSHVHDLRAQIHMNDMVGGWGLAALLRYFDAAVKALVTIASAIALTVSLFLSRVPQAAGALTALNHPLFIAGIVAVMLAVTFASPMLSNAGNGFWMKLKAKWLMTNRLFNFYGMMGTERERALDIRMYRQDILCMKYVTQNTGISPGSDMSRCIRGPMGVFQALSAAVSQVFTGIVYAFVCCKAWAGAFGVGSVTQYIGAITALSGGVSSLISTLGDLRTNAAFLRTTFEFLDIPNDMYQGSLNVEKRSDRKYEIEFRDVSFQYPSSDDYALRHVSLTFRVGQRLAVVGMNGSGKTTFIKLLCRLYDPTEGVILLNGIDIRKYSYHEYMSIFSVVFQDFKLLSFGLGENVAARAAYDGDQARACLEGAGFGERLRDMPDGLQTYLYKDFVEAGTVVSGGEAQKIAMARALYKDAPFIILDEPTAALDPIAEFDVYSRMNEIVGDKTAVFISHRLSSCRFCNDIAVFHEGALVQRGSHEALVGDAGGKYAELWNAQAQYYA